MIAKFAATFDLPENEEPFRDERRVRERLQVLNRAGLVRSSTIATSGGGVANWYRLTTHGYRLLYGEQAALPRKTLFEPIKVSRQEHTVHLAESIVHTLVAAEFARIQTVEYRRENGAMVGVELEGRGEPGAGPI